MYIRKQPSGSTQVNVAAQRRGRGEYEISGEFETGGGNVDAARLVEHELIVEFGRYGYHKTGNILKAESGKKRVRLVNRRSHVHLARQIQAVLLFPKSRRDENGFVGGEPTIWHERYIVRKIHFAGLELRSAEHAFIRLGELELDNGSQTAHVVPFEQRMKLIETLHDHIDRFPDVIKSLLVEHRTMLTANGAITGGGEDIVASLMNHVAENAPDYNVEYVLGGDVVPALVDILSVPTVDEPVSIEAIPPEDIEIRLRETAKWRRWAATRGPSSARFRRNVREAYDSRCIVCGIRLPLSKHCRVPGVDSAHILPWSTHDLEVVSNGLCLCKLHHWAFDQQLIAIQYTGGTYVVTVSQRARAALDSDALEMLERIAGPVPQNRLPAKPQDMPHPQFLSKLYELLGD